MRGSRTTVGIAALLFTALQVAYAQDRRPTIPEIVANSDPLGGFASSTIPSGKAPAVDVVLKRVDTVVRGTVGEPRSYLSDDQRDVLTDYPIVNPTFIHQNTLATTRTPGIPPSISVTLIGGTVHINGKKYEQREGALPSLPSGTECLFLLSRVGEHYMIAGRYYGAFAITGGKISALTADRGYAPEYQNAPATQVIADLLSRLRR
jgi:hypothetical protein